MFNVGDKYKLVDPVGAMMGDTPKDTILEVVDIDGSGDGLVTGHGPNSADFISSMDIHEGYIIKSESIGGFHMDLTFDTTTTTDVREILCRAAEQVHDKTGIRLEEVDFRWLDRGDGPYIDGIHIEGGA